MGLVKSSGRLTAARTATAATAAVDDAWREAFHAGDRAVLARAYEAHFAVATRAIEGILETADRETVIHEVFSRLIERPELRRSFQGGSFAAWLATVVRNHAIDYGRRRARERPLHEGTHDDDDGGAEAATGSRWPEEIEARMLVERFCREVLPPAWGGTFELRFVRQLSQRDAARALGIHRATLVYRELRIRRLLRRFLLDDDELDDDGRNDR